MFQFQVGTKLPTTYAFALVERCQNDGIRLRMYLSGEVTHMKTNGIDSFSRLLNVRSMITSTNDADRLFYSLKVTFLLI